MILFKRFIFLLSLLVAVAARSENRCAIFKEPTDAIIAYMSTLLENQIIGDQELHRLIHALEKNQIENPISEKKTWTSSSALIHRNAIQKYIDAGQLNSKQLLEWAQKNLKEKNRVKERREETKVETQNILQKMELNEVGPGQFQMSNDLQPKVKVKLTHTIAVMTTKVTQQMWFDEMGENPSHFVDGVNKIIVSRNGKSVKMQPENPVESISWWSAAEFANRISKKMGFEPVYDLSQIKWKDKTSAELGTLQPETDEEGLKLKFNAPKNDIYKTKGFRFGTEAEKEYLFRKIEKPYELYKHGIAESDLKDLAWYGDNSGFVTHPVASTTKSFVIDGKVYHDLLGNVFEWGDDLWSPDTPRGGVNPRGADAGIRRITRGGCWFSRDIGGRQAGFPPDFVAGNRNSQFSYSPDPAVGIRLVRTLK